MATARDLITGSLRLLSVIATGETPSSNELKDGMSALNEMLQSWSTENLLSYRSVREEFPLVVGKASYTMGPGGDFDTTRPLEIENVLFQQQPGSPQYEIPVEIITKNEFAAITTKDTTSTIPTRMYPEGTSPLETLNFWPVPSVGNDVVFYSQKELQTFTNLSTDIELPPGFLRAMRYNLAVEMAPEYGKEASPTVAMIATESKANLKRQNIRSYYLQSDAVGLSGGGNRFDYRTGE